MSLTIWSMNCLDSWVRSTFVVSIWFLCTKLVSPLTTTPATIERMVTLTINSSRVNPCCWTDFSLQPISFIFRISSQLPPTVRKVTGTAKTRPLPLVPSRRAEAVISREFFDHLLCKLRGRGVFAVAVVRKHAADEQSRQRSEPDGQDQHGNHQFNEGRPSFC